MLINTNPNTNYNTLKQLFNNTSQSPQQQQNHLERKCPSESYIKLRNMFEQNNSTHFLISSTKSAISTGTPKILESPRSSSSDQQSSKRLSLLATNLQNKRPINVENDIKNIEEYINHVKNSTSSSSNLLKHRQRQISKQITPQNTIRRKRGKTLPVAQPSPIEPLNSSNLRTKKPNNTLSSNTETVSKLNKPSTPMATTNKPITAKMATKSLSTTTTTSKPTMIRSTPQLKSKKSKDLMQKSSSATTTKRDQKISTSSTTRKIGGLVSSSQPEPMTAELAIKLYKLTPVEQEEIQKYETVYFVSHRRQTVYDDERGDYLIQLHDHIDYRYEILDVLGKGSFGQVLKCFDHQLKETVALKIIRNKKRFHTQALVEVKILEQLLTWDPKDKHHNVRMLRHFEFRGHLCITFECLGMNLYEFLKSNRFQGSSMGLVRRFAIQLLNSLTLLQQHHLIHCDLKPENILLKSSTKSIIKVIDFGSSCLETEKVYTYIQSRFYRSPEVILGMGYNQAIDMWSVGCILVELYTGYPLFPGENEQDQLACIMEVKGTPDPHLIEKSSRKKLFFDAQGKPLLKTNRKRVINSKSIERILKTTDVHFLDFIKNCLNWDPEKRLKPNEALQHPWLIPVTKKKKTIVNKE